MSMQSSPNVVNLQYRYRNQNYRNRIDDVNFFPHPNSWSWSRKWWRYRDAYNSKRKTLRSHRNGIRI